MTNICCLFASCVLLNDALSKLGMLFEEHRVSAHLLEHREGVTRVLRYFQTQKINQKKDTATETIFSCISWPHFHRFWVFPPLSSASLFTSPPASEHQATTSATCDSLSGLNSQLFLQHQTCIVISALNNESLNTFRVLLRKPLNFPLRREGAIQLLFLMRTTDMQSHPSSVSAAPAPAV